VIDANLAKLFEKTAKSNTEINFRKCWFYVNIYLFL